MKYLLLLVCVLGVVRGQLNPPAKCCTDREFEVTMGEVGGSMYDKNGHYVQSFIQGYNRLYYDAHQQMTAVDSVITTDGKTVKTNVVMDYPRARMYVTSEAGNCTSYPIVEKFRQPCIPDDSVFEGYSTMGYGVQKLELVSWRYLQPGTDHMVKMSLTKDGCIPVVLAYLGHFSENNATLTETFFLYNNFSPTISNRAVFRHPSGCARSPTPLPQPFSRSTRALQNVIRNL